MIKLSNTVSLACDRVAGKINCMGMMAVHAWHMLTVRTVQFGSLQKLTIQACHLTRSGTATRLRVLGFATRLLHASRQVTLSMGMAHFLEENGRASRFSVVIIKTGFFQTKRLKPSMNTWWLGDLVWSKGKGLCCRPSWNNQWTPQEFQMLEHKVLARVVWTQAFFLLHSCRYSTYVWVSWDDIRGLLLSVMLELDLLYS
jgi:hypothetical protein